METVFMAAFMDELEKLGAFGLLGKLDAGVSQPKGRKGWVGAPGDPMRTNIKQRVTNPMRTAMKQPSAMPIPRLSR